MPTSLHYQEAREVLDKIDEIGPADPDLAMKYLDWIEQIYDRHGLNVSSIARARDALGELDAALGSIFADCEAVGVRRGIAVGHAARTDRKGATTTHEAQQPSGGLTAVGQSVQLAESRESPVRSSYPATRCRSSSIDFTSHPPADLPPAR